MMRKISTLLIFVILILLVPVVSAISTSDVGNLQVNGWFNQTNSSVDNFFSGNLDMGGNNVTNVDMIKGSGDNVRIGDGVDSHSLSSSNDLLVSGKFEVNAQSYFDNTVDFFNYLYLRTGGTAYQDDIQQLMGAGNDVQLEWDTGQTPDSLLLGLGSDSNAMLFIEKADFTTDFAHPLQTDPTIFIHSASGTSLNATSISHDGVDAVIDNLNGGNISLEDSVRVEGDLTIGDKVGTLAYWDYNNGTFNIFESFLNPFAFLNYTIFTDNVSIEGDLDVTGNFTGNQIYGEMWFHNDSATGVTTTIGTQSVWHNITGFNQATDSGQTLNGFTFDSTEEHLTALVAGKYDVDYSLSFGNVGNNEEYQLKIFINEVEQNNTDTHRKIGANGDVGNVADGGFIDLVPGDNVSLRIRDNDGTSDVYGHSTNVNLVRIGS